MCTRLMLHSVGCTHCFGFVSNISFRLWPDLEWKVTYVGSAEDTHCDQELLDVLVGPVPVGLNRFVLEVRNGFSRRAPQAFCIGVPRSTWLDCVSIRLMRRNCRKSHPRTGLVSRLSSSRACTRRRNSFVLGTTSTTSTLSSSQKVLRCPHQRLPASFGAMFLWISRV
jgi:hypothetical protein